MFDHDFTKYPELTQKEIDEFGFLSPFPQMTEDFYATVVKVHDGDTISLQVPQRDFIFPIRFANIDAPELNAGGDTARDWVKNLIENQEIYIILDKKNRVDKYGRLLGNVIHRGLDVGEQEIYLGLATSYEQRREGEIQSIEKQLVQSWL